METQLRAADVSFPGAGIFSRSHQFCVGIQVVVFATLVLFAHWLGELTRLYHKGSDLQWVLVDERTGIVGMVARMWVIAIVVGPWVLGIVFVEAMALTLRTKGMLNTPALEGVFSIYVGIVVVMLTVPAKAAAQGLIELRRLARSRLRWSSAGLVAELRRMVQRELGLDKNEVRTALGAAFAAIEGRLTEFGGGATQAPVTDAQVVSSTPTSPQAPAAIEPEHEQEAPQASAGPISTGSILTRTVTPAAEAPVTAADTMPEEMESADTVRSPLKPTTMTKRCST